MYHTGIHRRQIRAAARLHIMKLLTRVAAGHLSVLRILTFTFTSSSGDLVWVQPVAAALSRIHSQITCCNLQLNTRMQIGSFAPPAPGCLPRLQQTCASTACQTACHTRRAVPLSQQFNQCNAFRQSCMQQRSGRRTSRGSKATVPQALFQNMFKSDEGGKTRKKYQQRVDRINGMESKYEQMDDEELKRQTEALRSRVANGEALESVLPEAFAVRWDLHPSQDSVSRLWSA